MTYSSEFLRDYSAIFFSNAIKGLNWYHSEGDRKVGEKSRNI